MQLFIKMPSCAAGQPLLQEMLSPQPVTWAAALLLLAGVFLLSRTPLRSKLAGQALLFTGMLLGAVPVMNRMLASVVDCAQHEQLARLADALPVANVIALLVLATCAVGVVWSLWRLRGATGAAA